MMDTLEGELSQRPALDVFRQLAIERRTGVLDLSYPEDAKEDRFFFLSGELYVAPDHPLAAALQLAGLDADDSPPASADQDESGRGVDEHWFEKVVLQLLGWSDGTFHFAEDLGGISSDLVGPAPTLAIVMAGAVSDLDEFGLLRVLGGEEARYAATPSSQAPPSELVQLTPDEAFFLSRMEQAVSVKELLAQSSLERMQGLQKLCRLLAAGLICREEDIPEVRSGSLLNPETLEKFSRRILAGLARQPLELDRDEHRRRIADLLGRLGGMTYYELLKIGVAATNEEIHDAYSQLARVVHPSHAKALGLDGKEGGMHLLLEKATEAYLTLNDQERSRRYFQEIGSPADLQGSPSGESRRDEVVRMAEENYRRARTMVARQDFHFAVELLQQGVRMHPKAEYYILLGRCQARNPRWLRKSLASYGRALQMDSENIEARLEMAGVLEAAGELDRASQEYAEVLRQLPSSVEAAAGLKRLDVESKRVGSSGSWLERMRDRLAGKKK